MKRSEYIAAFSEEKKYDDLTVRERVGVLFGLCQWNISENEGLVEFANTKLEPEDLRVQPIGQDAMGCKFWYFRDLRLYREVPPKRASKKGKASPGVWEIVCSSADEWTLYCKRFEKSKNAAEKELFSVLRDDISPIVLGKLQAKQREEEKRMMYELMPKKRSTRLQVIDIRKQDEEKRAIMRKEEEKLKAFERSQLKKQRELEEKQKREEEEKVMSEKMKKKEEKEKREKLERERERRAQERHKRLEERQRQIEEAELARLKKEHQRKKRAEKRRRLALGLPTGDLSSDEADEKTIKKKGKKGADKSVSSFGEMEGADDVNVVDVQEDEGTQSVVDTGEKYVFSTQLANAAARAVLGGCNSSLVEFYLEYQKKKAEMKKMQSQDSVLVSEGVSENRASEEEEIEISEDGGESITSITSGDRGANVSSYSSSFSGSYANNSVEQLQQLQNSSYSQSEPHQAFTNLPPSTSEDQPVKFHLSAYSVNPTNMINQQSYSQQRSAVANSPHLTAYTPHSGNNSGTNRPVPQHPISTDSHISRS